MLRMAGYLKHYPVAVCTALFLMLGSNILALAGPKISGLAIDAIAGGRGRVDFPAVRRYVLMLVVFYLLSAVMAYLLSVLMVRLGQKIIYTLRRQVFEHLMTLPVSYFDSHPTGDIISRISYDIDTLNTSLSHDLLQLAASTVTVVGALFMMFSISRPLLLIFAVTVPASILFTRFKTKHIHPLFRARSVKLGELNGYAEEMLSGQKTVRAYSAEDVTISRFDTRNEAAVGAYYKAEWYGAMIGPAVNLINNISIALITLFGGVLFLLTQTKADLLPIFMITLGGVSSFVQYSRKFAGPINELANMMSEFQSALAAAERVFRLLDEPSEVPDREDAVKLPRARGDVRFEDVTFGYTPDKTVLHHFSLSVTSGQTVAIVGPTGAGKTTVINLLMRFYDISEGAICLDGRDVREITRETLRKNYTMVLQDTWLFYGTIFENIAYGREDVTREDVERAARAAYIHDFILSLPQGYDTILSDDGVNISKGQKQLITIARAMLSDAPILILDEATSNVDSRTEQKIQAAMHALMRHRTAFVIAHRLSTVQNADVILVVQKGSVIERGTHEELLAAGGFYATLYRSQFT